MPRPNSRTTCQTIAHKIRPEITFFDLMTLTFDLQGRPKGYPCPFPDQIWGPYVKLFPGYEFWLRHTQTDRKWCIRAHRAYAQVGSKTKMCINHVNSYCRIYQHPFPSFTTSLLAELSASGGRWFLKLLMSFVPLPFHSLIHSCTTGIHT